MLTLCRIIAGAGLALVGLVSVPLALYKHGAWVALCLLLLCEGLAALILPDLGRDSD